MNRPLIAAYLIVVALAARATNAADPPAPPEPAHSTPADLLKKSKRMLFLGDSITAGGGYIADFEAWLLAQPHGPRPTVINAGLSSETVSGLSEAGHAGGKFPRPDLAERLDRVLAATRPDLVVACYGINCGVYQPFDEERFQKYRQGIERLKQTVEKSGAKLVLMTPPVYDDSRAKNTFRYNEVLDRYSAWLVEQRQRGWLVIDLHEPMTRALADRKQTDPQFTFQPDAVHPNAAGHWFIAQQLCRGFGDRGLTDAATPTAMLKAQGLPESVLGLIEKRAALRRDAYVAAAGHKRPGVSAGLPIAEAEKQAAAITAEIDGQLPKPPQDPPGRAGAEISVKPDKPEYFLGENVILHWRIQNNGHEPLKFTIGGDGRTPIAKRAIRFKVEVVDSDGNSSQDPYPNPPNMGGWGGGGDLTTGQGFSDDLQLMRYREIARPGEYTVMVYHDLGWENRDATQPFAAIFAAIDSSNIPPMPHAGPVVTTVIRFLAPNDSQARQIVKRMLAMPKDSGRTWGERGGTFADFELLCYPVYLPIMKELAEQGDPRGLEAIGAMAFPEATAALLKLMKRENAEIAAKAGDLLLARTPYVHDVRPSRRNYLLERSWTDELKQATMPLAWKLLAGDDREDLIRGARLVQSLGAKKDLPALIQVMDRALVALKEDDVEQRSYLRPQNVSDGLADASRELMKRGAQPPDSTETAGAAVSWLVALGANEDFRPDGWRDTLRKLMQDEIPFIRSVALQNAPPALDDATVAVVAKAIQDEFDPVQGAACELAFKVKSKSFGPPLTEVLKTTNNDWVLRDAYRALSDCGVGNDQRMEVLVASFEPCADERNLDLLGRQASAASERNTLRLSLLVDSAIETNGYGFSGPIHWADVLPTLRPAWSEFIAAHRQELRDGKRFPAASPPLNRQMAAPGFQVQRAGLPPWPEKPAP